ncbi:MAG: hypothetical protein K2L41_08180, partial [Muribaculaceae bacterium]|nr:hypothetical protein [Muribaculaceae bacterium]
PARLAALAPETSASTIPPPGLLMVQRYDGFLFCASFFVVFFRFGFNYGFNAGFISVFVGRFVLIGCCLVVSFASHLCLSFMWCLVGLFLF